ncbi:MAG: flagellar hook-associated protein FlgL [Pseudomonadota bacterium]
MRITTNLLFDQNLRAINNNQGKLSDIQTQLATGKKLLRPSDDPVGAVQVIRLTEELDKAEQFKRNITLARNSLELQETTLRSLNEVVNRARVLTVQASSGILTSADRKTIAEEIEQLRNQTIDLMNTQNASGEYIFAGYQSDQIAFRFDPSNTADTVSFVGDDGTNSIQISDSVTVQTTSSGRTIFEDVYARQTFDVTNAVGSLTYNSSSVVTQALFDDFYRSNFDPGVPANNQFEMRILAGNALEVTNLGTGAVVGTATYIPDEPIVFQGMSFDADTIAPGDTIEFELPRPVKSNLAESLHSFALALQSDTISENDYTKAVNDSLVGLDNGLTQMARESSSIGGRINILDSVEGTILDSELANEAARGLIQDVDFAEASSEFSKQETALSAAFASFPRIASLSLFDYI